MATTGAPWNLFYPLGTDLVKDGAGDIQQLAEDVAAGLDLGAKTQRVTLTASNASYSVPTAARKNGVKITCIGGGGGANNAGSGSAGAGGTTSFGSFLSAAGGGGGPQAGVTGNNGAAGWRSDNHGTCQFNDGQGGQVLINYVDLSAATTVNVTIGAGGAGNGGGGSGGRGEIVLEF
jgi:hypothetical protein